MSTEVCRSSQNVVDREPFKFMKESGAIVQPIRTVWVDEFLGFDAVAGTEEKRNNSVETFLKAFSKHSTEVLACLLKEILQE